MQIFEISRKHFIWFLHYTRNIICFSFSNCLQSTNYFLAVFGKQMNYCFFHQTTWELQQAQQQPQPQQQNDHRPTVKIQSASIDFIPEIVMDYQAHQPPKTFKFPEIVYGKKKKRFQHLRILFCEENERRCLTFGRC